MGSGTAGWPHKVPWDPGLPDSSEGSGSGVQVPLTPTVGGPELLAGLMGSGSGVRALLPCYLGSAFLKVSSHDIIFY